MIGKSFAIAVYRLITLLGINPREWRHLKNIPRFMRDRRQFLRAGGRIDSYYPILQDYSDASGSSSGHYFHQDLLVAQFIFDASPQRHIDVASRIDGFVAHVASFREIEVLDIRPLEIAAHPKIRFIQADLMAPIATMVGAFDSVSCLHALEHFGLGRYTDSISINGFRSGFGAIAQLVKAKGHLYVSVPVGRARVEFNAHRIFAPSEPVVWAQEEGFSLQRFDYVDDVGALYTNSDPDRATNLKYGCGIYSFERV